MISLQDAQAAKALTADHYLRIDYLQHMGVREGGSSNGGISRVAFDGIVDNVVSSWD